MFNMHAYLGKSVNFKEKVSHGYSKGTKGLNRCGGGGKKIKGDYKGQKQPWPY